MRPSRRRPDRLAEGASARPSRRREPRRVPQVRVQIKGASGPKRPRRQLHSNPEQLNDFYALSDDFDAVVDSLSSFVYFATLFTNGLKFMLNWMFPYEHLSCALNVAWRRPERNPRNPDGPFLQRRHVAPLVDVDALAAALERYAATESIDDSHPHSCYALNETAMRPYVHVPNGGRGTFAVTPAPKPGAVVVGLKAAWTDPTAPFDPLPRPTWTRWPTTCAKVNGTRLPVETAYH